MADTFLLGLDQLVEQGPPVSSATGVSDEDLAALQAARGRTDFHDVAALVRPIPEGEGDQGGAADPG